MAKIKGNAVVGQSGGPTVVINQSLAGVVKAAQERDEIGKIYGARNGVRGMKEEKFIELHDLRAGQLEAVALTPSSALMAMTTMEPFPAQRTYSHPMMLTLTTGTR